MPKVELHAAIRRDARAGMSARAIEREYRVGRRTIIKALAASNGTGQARVARRRPRGGWSRDGGCGFRATY